MSCPSWCLFLASERLRSLVSQLQASHPALQDKVDVEAELAYYRGVREELLLMTTDTIDYMNRALLEHQKVLVEGDCSTRHTD